MRIPSDTPSSGIERLMKMADSCPPLKLEVRDGRLFIKLPVKQAVLKNSR